MVAAVQGIEGVNQEVDQGASGGNRPVHLPCPANGHLSLLGLLHLLCNIYCSALGLLQILNQGYVLKNVTLQDKVMSEDISILTIIMTAEPVSVLKSSCTLALQDLSALSLIIGKSSVFY